jgi:ABC-type glycerol-3-phosphate transport system substrate-binding protein
MKKRFLPPLLIVLLILTACGNVTRKSDFLFGMTETPLGEKFTESVMLPAVIPAPGGFYAVLNNYDTEAKSNSSDLVFIDEGGISRSKRIYESADTAKSKDYLKIFSMPDGNIVVLSAEAEITEPTANEDGLMTLLPDSDLIFEEYDSDFSLIKSAAVGKIHSPGWSMYPIFDGEFFYYYYDDNAYNSAAENPNDDLCVYKVNRDFEIVADENPSRSDATPGIQKLIIGGDGRVYTVFSENLRTVYFKPFGADEYIKANASQRLELISDYAADGDEDFLFYCFNREQNLYGIDKKGSLTLVMTNDESPPDLFESFISGTLINGSRISLGVSGGVTSETRSFVKREIVKIPRKDDREVIKITAAAEINDDLRLAVYEYNRQSEDYKVEIELLGMNDENILSAFDSAVLRGELGDIVIPPEESRDIYVKKDLFADLYPYLTEANGLTADSFSPSVLKTAEDDGKLFGVFRSFYLGGMFASPETAAIYGTSYAEILRVVRENPYALPYNFPPDSVLRRLLENNYAEFADKNFTDETLENILNISNSYKNELPQDEFINRFADKKGVFADNDAGYIYNISDIGRVRDVVMMRASDTIIPVGVPSESGEKITVLHPTVTLFISDGSAKKDKAFDFIKYWLTFAPTDEHYQKARGFYSISALADKYKEDTLAYAAAKKAEYGDDYSEMMSNSIPVRLPTEEDFAIIEEMIKNAYRPTFFDPALMNIITEEAKGYFDGKADLTRTTELISERIGVYLDEKQ